MESFRGLGAERVALPTDVRSHNAAVRLDGPETRAEVIEVQRQLEAATSAAREEINQQGRQLRQIEAACIEYRDAIVKMQQRLDELARRQVGSGLRAAALQLLAPFKDMLSKEELLPTARLVYEFLAAEFSVPNQEPEPQAEARPTPLANGHGE